MPARFALRLCLILLLLGGFVGLSGCNSSPPDPYNGMQMLTPQEAGVTQREEDPVLQAEKAHNARFIRKP